MSIHSALNPPPNRSERITIELPEPIVELAGPTKKGFRSLEGKTFHRRPFVSNIGGQKYNIHREPDGTSTFIKGPDSLTPIDLIELDALIDMRKLPFKENSIGTLLVAAPTNTTYEQIIELRKNPHLSEDQQDSVSRLLQDSNFELFLNKIDTMNKKALARQPEAIENPAIGMLLEAQRVLKKNGKLVLKNIDHRLLRIATELGFEIENEFGHRIKFSRKEDPSLFIVQEVILKKSETKEYN